MPNFVPICLQNFLHNREPKLRASGFPAKQKIRSRKQDFSRKNRVAYEKANRTMQNLPRNVRV